MTHDVAFAQGHGFVVEASSGLQCSVVPLPVAGWPRRGHRSLATSILFGKLFCTATLYDFGEKRCRRNHPLYTLLFHTHHRP